MVYEAWDGGAGNSKAEGRHHITSLKQVGMITHLQRTGAQVHVHVQYVYTVVKTMLCKWLSRDLCCVVLCCPTGVSEVMCLTMHCHGPLQNA